MSGLGAQFKKLRTEKGLTQKQVAHGLKMPEQQYQKYEYGERVPSARVLINMADFFDVSLDYLVGYNDDSEAQQGLRTLLSERFAQILKDRGISQAQIAERFGVSKSYVLRIVNGESAGSIEFLAEIAHYLNVSLDYLVGLSDNPERR